MIKKLALLPLTVPFLLLLILLPIGRQLDLKWPEAQAQSPQKFKTQEEEIRQQMLIMSRHLGVTCTTCHKTENFQADDLPAFKTAKAHIRLTQALIDNGLDGSKKDRPKADCYMCHRGQLMPDYKEKLDPMRKDPLKKLEPAHQLAPNQPTAAPEKAKK